MYVYVGVVASGVRVGMGSTMLGVRFDGVRGYVVVSAGLCWVRLCRQRHADDVYVDTMVRRLCMRYVCRYVCVYV